jgi:hypothetical protein
MSLTPAAYLPFQRMLRHNLADLYPQLRVMPPPAALLANWFRRFA